MPIISRVDHKRREVEAMAVGPVSFADVAAHFSHERHRHGLSYPAFLDVRAAGIAFSPDEARQIGELIRNLARETKLGRTAILVSSDEGFAAVCKLEEMVGDVCELKAFRDEQDARAWLARRGRRPIHARF